MSLRNVASLYLVRLRGRVGQELLALVGIAVGVSLLFAALVANASLTGSFERLTHGVVGNATLQLTARSSDTISEGMLSETRRLPGVSKAVGILELRGEAAGKRGQRSVLLIGIPPNFGDLGGSLTRGFSYSFLSDVRAMALPTPLVDALGVSLGGSVAFNLNGRERQARLGAKLQRSDVGGMFNSSVAIASLRYAQELADAPGAVSRIFVVPEPGQTSEARRELERLAAGRANVRPADFDTALFTQASVPTSQSTAMFSVFGAMVGFLFAFSAMLLTAPQRRHLIADLDAEGYRPRTILKVLLFDAVVLGVVASALGIALGEQVAQRLFDTTPAFLQYAFTVGSQRIITPGTVALAAAGGVLASCIAVLGPTVSALRDQPRDAEPSEPQNRRRGLVDRSTGAGLVLLGVGILIVVATPTSATIGIAGLGCLTMSMLLLLPAFLHLLVAIFDRVTENVRGVVPFLVSFDLRDRTTQLRSLAVAATGAIAVFASVALQGAHADLLRGLDQTSRDIAGIGDVWARAPGADNLLVTTRFRTSTVRMLDGIGNVAMFRGGFLDIGDRRTRVLGVPLTARPPLSSIQYLDGNPRDAEKRLSEGGWMVISADIAREHALAVGDTFTLPSPVPTTFRVAALSTNLGWPPGSIVINAEDYKQAWGSSDASAIVAQLMPGTSEHEGEIALRAGLDSSSSLDVETSSAFEQTQMLASREGVARLTQIATLVLVSAVLAMAAAMGGLIWQRRGFLAGVKVDGYGTTDMWKALSLEAAILIGAGCAFGAAFGLLGQGLLSRALTSVTGFPVIYSLAAVDALLTCLAVTLAALAMVAIFGQRAASVAPESGLNG